MEREVPGRGHTDHFDPDGSYPAICAPLSPPTAARDIGRSTSAGLNRIGVIGDTYQAPVQTAGHAHVDRREQQGAG
jgi:hypothetical protein